MPISSNYTAISTDTTGVTLARSSSGDLYILDGDKDPLLITEATYYNYYNNSYNTPTPTPARLENTGNNYIKEAVAVEKQADGSYVLATKEVNGANTSWLIYNIASTGSITTYSYSKGISNKESLFDQDLNGDGVKGLDTEHLTQLDTDTNGARLVKDIDGVLYIKDGSNAPLLIKDGMGNPPDWTSSNNGYSNLAMAVEKQTDGSYIVAVKNTYGSSSGSSTGGTSSESWQSFTVSKDGVYQYPMMGGHNLKTVDAEVLVNEDFDNNGIVGIDPSTLTRYSTDELGTSMVAVAKGPSGDNGLYILDGDRAIAIKDPYGSNVSWDSGNNINNTSGGVNNGSSSLPYAAEKQADGSYKIAVKQTNWQGDRAEVSWNIYSVSSKGAYNWGQINSKTIGRFEKDFNQDLNNDGSVGINYDLIVKASTDTTGAQIGHDAEGALYILDGNNTPLALKDTYGNVPWWSVDSSSTSGGSGMSTSTNISQVVATEKQSNGTYKILHKNQSGETSNPQTTWSVYTVSKQGVFDSMASMPGYSTGSSSGGMQSGSAVGPYEKIFKQDLNGDGVIGVNLSTVASVTTDTTGAMLAKDAEGSLYIKDGDKSPIAIAASNGSSPSIESNNTWNRNEAIALERQADGKFKLAVKQTYNNGANGNSPDVSWNIYTIESTGTFNWQQTNTRNIATYETLFNQDLSGDSFIGVDPETLTQIATETDTTGDSVWRDTSGTIYIKQASDGKIITVMPGNGGMAMMGSPATTGMGGSTNAMFEYSNGSRDSNWYNEARIYAVEKQSDGTYKLAVKQTNINNNGNGPVTDVNWQVYSINSAGEVVGYPGGTRSITSYEESFNQDMNDDRHKGVNIEALQAATTDTTGAILYKDPNDKSLYIKDGDKLITIKDSNGGVPTFDYANSYSSGDYSYSNSSVSYAAEKQADGVYKVAIKNSNSNSNTNNGKPDTSWQIYTVSAAGVLDWSMGMGGWTKSVASSEPLFKQDLNGDGTIGVDVQSLKVVKTDTYGVTLAKDAEGALYIKDGDKAIALKDNWGGTPSFDYANSWSGGSNSSAAYAIEKMTSGEFKLAVKSMYESWGSSTTNWQTYTINADGVMNWMSSSYGQSIANYESIFKQDLNEDGRIGIDTSNVKVVETDTYGVLLAKGTDNNYFIKNADGSFTSISGGMYGSSNFDYAYSWGSGSNSSKAIAVEQLNSGNFRLAVKQTNTYNDKTDVNWQVYTLSADGSMDNSGTSWTKSIASTEKDFGQDLNGDGTIGLKTADLVAVTTDTHNEQLMKDKEGALYIKLQNEDLIAITDKNGGTPTFDYANTWSNGSSTNAAYAIEKQTNGTFKLAVKNTNTNTFSETQDVNWQTYTLSASGVLDWQTSTWGKSVASYENWFSQDLDQDGTIGIDTSSLTATGHDTAGATLVKDGEGVVMIKSVDGTYLTIKNNYGGAPNFDYQSDWGDNNSFTSESYAVETVKGGGYKLAVKQTSTNSGTDTVTWQVYNINSSGFLDWGAAASVSNTGVADYEDYFNLDLNGIGGIGQDLSGRPSLTSDTQGDELVLDSANGAHIKLDSAQTIDGQSVTHLTIRDSSGIKPNFDYTDGWYGNSTTSVSFAVEALEDGTGFHYAVKQTTVKGSSSQTVYQLYKLDETGVLDWSSATNVKTVQGVEKYFNQDFDDVGTTIGYDTASIQAESTDTGSVVLVKDPDKALYIRNTQIQNGEDLAIQDKNGGFVTLDFTDEANGYSRSAVAITQLGDASYKLAVKLSTTVNNTTTESWEIYAIDKDGILDWTTASHSKGVAALETNVFEQNLDSISGYTFNTSALTGIDTDTTGVGVARDTLGNLYIKQVNNEYLAITDLQGGAPMIEESATWGDNTSASSVVAVEKQGTDAEANYKLVVKTDSVLDGEAATSWMTYGVSSTGILDVGTGVWSTTIGATEIDMAQDLNGDGIIGEVLAASNTNNQFIA